MRSNVRMSVAGQSDVFAFPSRNDASGFARSYMQPSENSTPIERNCVLAKYEYGVRKSK